MCPVLFRSLKLKLSPASSMVFLTAAEAYRLMLLEQHRLMLAPRSVLRTLLYSVSRLLQVYMCCWHLRVRRYHKGTCIILINT